MKKVLTVIIILAGNISFAQHPTQQIPTRFDKFILSPDIKWAAYINDTIRFESPNLNKILISRLTKNEIKASLTPYNAAQADQVKFLNKKDIDNERLYPNYTPVPQIDSMGNRLPDIKREDLKMKIDAGAFTLTDVTQILYIVKGELRTYVPWVTTMFPVITSFGLYLGDGDYFSTCYNPDHTYRPGKKNRILFLSQSIKRIRLDSFDVKSKLKELYGRNMVQTLWPYILENRFEMVDMENNKPVKAEELDASLVTGRKILVPVYDADGKQTGASIEKEPLLPDQFSSVELIQDWYYDQTKNIVFNITRELYLYAKKWTAEGEAKEPSPILKIVFK